MVDALMQFTDELSTDSDCSDDDDGKEINGGGAKFSWDLGDVKPASALPPMMLSDSHVDISTEEEDNNDNVRYKFMMLDLFIAMAKLFEADA